MKKIKFKISSFNKHLIFSISFLFLYLFYLSIPSLYDKGKLQKDLTEKILNEFKINISTFDLMQIQFLTNDKKMRIESISGINYYKNNIKDCYEKLDDIYEEVVLVLSSWKVLGKETYEVSSNKITDYMLESNSQDEVQIGCYDYFDDTKNVDHFRIAIRTSGYRTWLREQVYN